MNPVAPRFLSALVALFASGVGVGYFTARPPRSQSAQAGSATAQPLAQRDVLRKASTAGAGRASTAPAARGEGAVEEMDLASALLAAAGQRDYYRRRHETYQVALQLDEEGLASALALTKQMPIGERFWLQPTLIARWLELNPDAAVAWVRALPPGKPRTELLGETFQTLGLKDPQAALRLLGESKAGDSERGLGLVRKLFDGWGHHDAAGAAAAALTLPRGQRSTALDASLYQWARIDPTAALAWLRRSVSAEERRGNADTIWRVWADADPQAAATHVQTLSGEEKTRGLGQVMRGLAASDPAAAERLLEQIPAGRARSQQIRSLLSAVDDENPQFAARLLLTLPPKDQESSAYSVARSYARHDRAGALEWAAQLALPAARDRALAQIVAEWSGADPRAAVQYCAQHLAGKEEPLRRALGDWASAEPEAALAWVKAQPAGENREQMLAAAATAISQNDRDAGLRVIESLPAGSSAQRRAIASIGTSWARTDASAALAWVSQLPPAAADVSISSILSTAAREDPTSTAGWLDKQPPGARRDNAVFSFTSAIVRDDPESAIAWAATISDPQQRANCLSNVFSNWSREDKAAALDWARKVPGLTDEQRRRYLERVEKTR